MATGGNGKLQSLTPEAVKMTVTKPFDLSDPMNDTNSTYDDEIAETREIDLKRKQVSLYLVLVLVQQLTVSRSLEDGLCGGL
jgi:hypothetical protein